MNYALELLAKKPDFDIDESFNFDREKEPWPANAAEMNELWRKRVKNDALSLITAGKQWPEAADILRKRYEHVAKRMDQSKPDDVFEAFMNAFVLSLDPHSNYFSARNSEEYNIQMSLSYEGIGASLQLTDDYVTVIDVIAGGPAAVSGKLAANDRITAVGEGKSGELTDVIGWRLDDVVQKIRGPGGTLVRLQLLPAGAAPGSAQKIVEFTRNRVSLEAQAAHKAMRTVQRNGRDVKVGIITVPSFYQDYDASRAGAKDYRSTTRDVQRLIGELRKDGAEVLIMDLRANGGGYLPEAESLTGLFIDRGPVVQLRDTTGRIEVDDDPDPAIFYSGPLIVLVDRFSASASEIFAGAIQDYGRGLIIGQQTYGKGTVQNAHPLNYTIFGRKPELGQLNVTIGKYYRITGESTQDRGVTPDIMLPSLIDANEVGESTRDRALPWDHIEPASFKVEGDLKPIATSLQKLHDERTNNSADFRYLHDDIAALEAMRNQKTLSLNLKTREAERKRQESERLARENALARRTQRACGEVSGGNQGRCGRGHHIGRDLADRGGPRGDVGAQGRPDAGAAHRASLTGRAGSRTLLAQQQGVEVPIVFREHVPARGVLGRPAFAASASAAAAASESAVGTVSASLRYSHVARSLSSFALMPAVLCF